MSRAINQDNYDKFQDLDFDALMVQFVFTEPFYAHISRKLHKMKSKKIPTAGVYINKGRFHLLYNEKFVKSLKWYQRFELLKHEIMHLIFGHCTSRRLTDDRNMHCIANIAQDLAINSLLEEERLPECVIMPGKLTEIDEATAKSFKDAGKEDELEAIIMFNALIASLPKEETAEWYFNRLTESPCCKKIAEMDNERRKNPFRIKIGKPGEGGLSREEYIEKVLGGMDEHDGFGEGLSEEEKAILKEDVRDMLEDAIREAERASNWGSIPGHLQQKLKQLASRQVNWKQLLKDFVGMAKSMHKTTTMKRINRRYPYIHAGVKTRRTARIAIAVDQSGSVHNEEIQLFFAELSSLAQYVSFEVIPFDSMVNEDEIFVWKRGSKLEPSRVCCGGTDFDVPTKYVNERTHHYDAMIIFTDGACCKPVPCKRKRLWLLPPNREMAFETNETVLKLTKMGS